MTEKGTITEQQECEGASCNLLIAKGTNVVLLEKQNKQTTVACTAEIKVLQHNCTLKAIDCHQRECQFRFARSSS